VDYRECTTDEQYRRQLDLISNTVGPLLEEYKNTGIPHFVNCNESVPHSVNDFYVSTTIGKILGFMFNSSWAKDFIGANWYLFEGRGDDNNTVSSSEVPLNSIAYAIYSVSSLLYILRISNIVSTTDSSSFDDVSRRCREEGKVLCIQVRFDLCSTSSKSGEVM
jgi:hypothetical protein